MIPDLELVDTEELIDELIKRHDDLVIITVRDNGPNRPDGNVKFCATDDEYRELDSFQFDGTIIGLNQ